MKKSCYALKQIKIEPHILSPYLSNKDSLAEDRGLLQVFDKLGGKNKQYLADTRMQSAKDISSVQNNSRLKVSVFCFFCLFFGKMIGHRY